MQIISHRGYWLEAQEKNTKLAFERSFDLGFGTETDIRDYGGEVLVVHDMPSGKEMTLDTFLDILNGRQLPIAFDIKANGLAKKLAAILKRRNLSNFFVFDMNVPDLFEHIKAGLPVFTRMSEHEREPSFYEQSVGVWLDTFHSLWYDVSAIEKILTDKKKVGVVSPELVGRKPKELWDKLRGHSILKQNDVFLCTDFPERAREFFGAAS